MAKISPFKAVRPQPQLAKQVASKPYDVLNSAEAKAEAVGNAYSFLHITKSEIDLPETVDIHSQQVYDLALENLNASNNKLTVIKVGKNIENINLNLDSTGQLVNSKDLNIFKQGVKNVTDFGMSKNDVIEFRVYDISDNLLVQLNGETVDYIHKDKRLLTCVRNCGRFSKPLTQFLEETIRKERIN